MSELVRASVSIERDLMSRFDELIARSGHDNRSEAVRDLIRARLCEDAWGDGVAEAVATVTLLYAHAERRLARRIEEHGHAHHGLVQSSLHVHVSAELCLEVVVLRGAPAAIKRVADHLVGLPGVWHGRAVFSPVAPPEAS